MSDIPQPIPAREIQLDPTPADWNPVPGATAPGASTTEQMFVAAATAAQAENAAQLVHYEAQTAAFIEALNTDQGTGSRPGPETMSTNTHEADTPMDGPVFMAYGPGKDIHWSPPGVNENP